MYHKSLPDACFLFYPVLQRIALDRESLNENKEAKVALALLNGTFRRKIGG
jgi:hypothetical protein